MPGVVSGLETVGQLCRRYDVQFWQLQRVLAADATLYSKVGSLRVVEAKDLPRLELALRRAGYLPESVEG